MTKSKKECVACEAANGKWYVALVDEAGFHQRGIGTMSEERAKRTAEAFNRGENEPPVEPARIEAYAEQDTDNEDAPAGMIGFVEVQTEDAESYPGDDQIAAVTRAKFGPGVRVATDSYADNDGSPDDYIWARYAVFAA